MTGLYLDKLTPGIQAYARHQRALTEALSELNRTPGTITDAQQASALQRILAKYGLELREVG